MGDSLLIATAGHVDHGKSTLVRMLTGIDPDRWQEEKDRGITIDLGYAHRSHKDRDYSFVDVPGHERFIHNMLAGIGSIDGVLLVVAADESIMPQTREHALALQYLGVSQIGVILTKCDLVDEDLLDLVHAELDDWLPGLGWEKAPRVHFSSTDAASYENVLDLLEHFEPKPTRHQQLFRMPIDRVFVSPGSGTVVTGTVDRGMVNQNDNLLLLPQNQPSRIRQIQVHGQKVDQASDHQRAAINLADFHHSQLHRGQILFANPGARTTRHLLVRLTLFCEWTPGPKHLFHIHHFSAHLTARMLWCEGDIAMFILDQEHPFWALDKGMIRDQSPLQVTGGFQVMHPFPVSTRRKRMAPGMASLSGIDHLEAWQLWFIENSPARHSQEDLLQACGAGLFDSLKHSLVQFEDGKWLSRKRFQNQTSICLQILKECHQKWPFYNALPLSWVRANWKASAIDSQVSELATKRLIQDGTLSLTEDRIKHRDHLSIWDQKMRARLDQLLEFPNSKLPLIDLRDFGDQRAEYETITSMLVWEKHLVSLTSDLLLPSVFLNQLISQLLEYSQSNLLKIGDLKAQLGLTRKVAIPLLEYLDKLGLTVREGDGRRWLQTHPEPIQSQWSPPG